MVSHSSSTAPAFRPRSDGLLALLLTASVAATASFVIHHLGPLAAHISPWTAVAVTSAALTAVLVGSVLAPYKVESPVVMVGRRAADVEGLAPGKIGFCSELHQRALSHGFFAALGYRFLNTYYRSFADSPHAVALIATIDGHPVGYLVGSARARAHRQWVLRHRGIRLALTGALALCAHPRAAARFLRTRVSQYARRLLGPRAQEVVATAGARDVAVLNHVAVLPGARGVGAGRALVESFEAAARAGGAETAYLTTLDSDAGAGAFYEQLSWKPGPTRSTPDGTRMQEWTRSFTSVAGS